MNNRQRRPTVLLWMLIGFVGCSDHKPQNAFRVHKQTSYHVTELEPPERHGVEDHFGIAVGIDGDTIAVGQHGYRDEDGRILLWQKDTDGSWRQSGQLVAPEESYGFGAAIAFRKGTLVTRESLSTSYRSIFAFRSLGGGRWSTAQELDSGDQTGFGRGIAADGDVLAYGSAVAGWVSTLTWNGIEWGDKQTATGGAQHSLFGFSIALANGDLVVADLEGSSDTPSLFRVHALTQQGWWVERQAIDIPEPQVCKRYDGFAKNLESDGARLVVSCFAANRAYVYSRKGIGWELTGTLVVPGSYNTLEGLAIHGSRAVMVGRGVHLFERVNTGWRHVEDLALKDSRLRGVGWDEVAISNGTIVVGSSGVSGPGGVESAGVAFVIEAATAPQGRDTGVASTDGGVAGTDGGVAGTDGGVVGADSAVSADSSPSPDETGGSNGGGCAVTPYGTSTDRTGLFCLLVVLLLACRRRRTVVHIPLGSNRSSR